MTAMASMPLGADRGEIEAAIDEAPVGEAPGVVAPRRRRSCSGGAGPASRGRFGGRFGSSPRRRPAPCPGPWRGSRPGAWPRPTPAPRRRCRAGRPSHHRVATGAGVHDLARAARIEARRSVGPVALAGTLPALLIAVIGGAVGAVAMAVRLRASRVAGGVPAPGPRCAVLSGSVVLRLREPVVGLLHADAVPGLGVGRQD